MAEGAHCPSSHVIRNSLIFACSTSWRVLLRVIHIIISLKFAWIRNFLWCRIKNRCSIMTLSMYIRHFVTVILFSDLFRVEMLGLAVPKNGGSYKLRRAMYDNSGWRKQTLWWKIFLDVVELLRLIMFIEIVRNTWQQRAGIVCWFICSGRMEVWVCYCGYFTSFWTDERCYMS
jgi:hypothetical protein